MEKNTKVSLRSEVTASDAEKMIGWLQDNDVTKFLNEDSAMIQTLRQIISGPNSAMLTYYLNQNGRFFLIDAVTDSCLGFIKLTPVKGQTEYEVVIAIGDTAKWHQGYGFSALTCLLSLVFFKWRIGKLIAKICPANKNSLTLFEKAGFTKVDETTRYYHYEITFDNYLRLKSSE